MTLDPDSWLGGIARIADRETRSICAENPDGSRGGGALAAPGDDPHCTPAARALGRGWKVRPCLRDVAPGQTVVLADIAGPGVIQHMWFTVQAERSRDLELRVHYDGAARPAIRCPLAALFANAINGLAQIRSLPIAVNPRGGLNSYWPMPFAERLRLEVANTGAAPIPELFYQITYALGPLPDRTARLHAQWRRATTAPERPEHVILDRVTGRGHYAGTYLAWHQRSPGWWGEGEIKFFIDGDPDDAPTICGTGTEDYFGGAWGFTASDPADTRPVTYSGPLLGYPQFIEGPVPGVLAVHGLYRWHLPDPICFKRDLRVTIQALGWQADGTYLPLTDEIESLALWYA